jgi:hypothetical protein
MEDGLISELAVEQRRGPVTCSLARSEAGPIIVSSPAFDDDFRFLRCVEYFVVQQFVAELRVEALAAVFAPATAIQSCTAVAINSAALLERIYPRL